MAKFYAFLLLILLGCTTGSIMLATGQEKGQLVEPTEYEDCRVIFNGGGCPDENACFKTCLPCFQLGASKQGLMESRCEKVGKGAWNCICELYQGAECPPFPGCPLSPSPPMFEH